MKTVLGRQLVFHLLKKTATDGLYLEISTNKGRIRGASTYKFASRNLSQSLASRSNSLAKSFLSHANCRWPLQLLLFIEKRWLSKFISDYALSKNPAKSNNAACHRVATMQRNLTILNYEAFSLKRRGQHYSINKPSC